MWGDVKLDDEGCLSFEVVGDKDMAAHFSIALDFNGDNLEEDRGNSQSKKI